MKGQKGPNLGRREEERLLDLARRTVGSEFPNPERAECPGTQALKALARRRLSKLKTDEIIDHIASCAPCFVEYNRYRREHWQRTIVGLISGCAVLAIAIGLLLHFSGVRFPRQPATQTAQARARAVILDLRDSSVERSGDARNVAPPKTLTREDLDLTIELPIGTEDGEYLLELRPSGDGAATRATGAATWNGTAEVLRTHLDLRGVAAGGYSLIIQKQGDTSGRTYRVIVE